MAKQPKLVEGYKMFIWEHEDGTVSYTGSFNASDWEGYTSSKRKDVVLNEASAGVPSPDDTTSPGPADLEEQPAGNANRDAWRAYALTQGATEDEVDTLTRDELREKYGKDD